MESPVDVEGTGKYFIIYKKSRELSSPDFEFSGED
jgi:hypothetical protein